MCNDVAHRAAPRFCAMRLLLCSVPPTPHCPVARIASFLASNKGARIVDPQSPPVFWVGFLWTRFDGGRCLFVTLPGSICAKAHKVLPNCIGSISGGIESEGLCHPPVTSGSPSPTCPTSLVSTRQAGGVLQYGRVKKDACDSNSLAWTALSFRVQTKGGGI